MEVRFNKENIPTPPFSRQKVLQCGTNYNGNAYGKEASSIEQTPLSIGNEDAEVNITGCTNSSKALMAEDSCDDATECSSSFGGTGSETENDAVLSDDEVASQMFADDAFSSMFTQQCEPSLRRKKKLTPHWMKFIRPYSWRIKWTELKIKQLLSQRLKYKKELAAYDNRKKHEYANFTLDGCDTKTVPLSAQIGRKKVMKRRKRKRVEETCNLASYMSNHSLFSYYENKDPFADARSNDASGVTKAGNAADNNEKIELNDILSSLEYKESDQPLVNFIPLYEALQSRVQKLRTRIDKAVSGNLGKSCSLNDLNMLEPSADDMNLSNPNSVSLAGDKSDEERKPAGPLAQVSEPELVSKNHVPKLQPTLRACSFPKPNVPKSTRKGKPKSGSKKRCRR